MAGEDRAYVAWVRTQPCAAGGLGDCAGPIEADHAGRRGLSQRAHDRTVIPLCRMHHQDRHHAAGPFRSWGREQLRDWLAEHVARTQAAYDRHGGNR